jgi:hypothetical protein
MKRQDSSLADWSPEQLAQGRAWIRAWRSASEKLERIRRQELRAVDTYRALEQLSGAPGPVLPARPSSGLVEQQRWFMRATGHHGSH